MGNNGVKGIVLVAILVVLSFLIGSQISGDKTVSFGIVGISIGLFLLLYMGTRSWWMLFLLPVVFSALGMRLPVPILLLLAPFFLVYWALLSLMGYTKFEWKSLWGMDIPVFLIFIDTCVVFINHPSSFLLLDQFLDMNSELIGGKEYWTCLLGVTAYICISLLPLKYENCAKLLKYLFYLTFAVQAFKSAYGIARPGASDAEDGPDLADRAENSRFDKLILIGIFGATYFYTERPFLQLLKKPFRLAALLISALCVVIGGWRTRIIQLAVQLFMLSVIKRELSLMVCIACAAYGSLLFLSNEHLLDDLPYGMQRSLVAIPGVHVRKDIEKEARASSDWRVVMWHWALDSRTGYIQDYVWGDGFNLNKADMQRDLTATMRGNLRAGDQQTFAKRGVWHSGWISTMHRLGIVGLVLLVLNQLCTLYYFFRLSFLLFRADHQTCIYFLCIYGTTASNIPLYHLSTGHPNAFYISIAQMAMIKLFYCCASKHFASLIKANSGRYVPMMIQETAPTPALRAL